MPLLKPNVPSKAVTAGAVPKVQKKLLQRLAAKTTTASALRETSKTNEPARFEAIFSQRQQTKNKGRWGAAAYLINRRSPSYFNVQKNSYNV